MDQEGRGFQKDRARELNSRATNDEQKANALWMMIEAYYNRNLESKSLRTYAAHFIAANRHKHLDEYDPIIIDLVWDSEGLKQPDVLKIKPGFSDWGSNGNSNYKEA